MGDRIRLRGGGGAATADAASVAPSTSAFQRSLVRWYERLALDPRYDLPFLALLLLAELGLGALVVRRVPYTEIDWRAYMQQVAAAWGGGERDYRRIRGDTGPLVYPAGFLYLFGALHRLTEGGTDVHRAQWIFLGFYLATQLLVLLVFQRRIQAIRRGSLRDGTATAKATPVFTNKAHSIWAWRVAMGLLCLSKRLHSIFLLRLFNDGPAMLLLYAALCLFQRYRWRTGCLMFSLAVSVKMNVLLFAPGLLLVLLQTLPDLESVVQVLLLCCALPQLLLGAPFLLTHPVSYLRKAFELDRSFLYEWTVNWKCIPENVFHSKSMHLTLLALHLSGLAVCAVLWLRRTKQLTGRRLFLGPAQPLSSHYIAYTLLVSNLVGVAFSRTLHYQFYAWYVHAVPYLLWTRLVEGPSLGGPRPPPRLLGMLGGAMVVAGLEFAFLTFPATATSSAVLQVCHLLVLASIRPPDPVERDAKGLETKPMGTKRRKES